MLIQFGKCNPNKSDRVVLFTLQKKHFFMDKEGIAFKTF